MRDVYQVIRRPLLTEKTNVQNEMMNKVVFEVDRRASKPEIREAVEKIFGVKVKDVHTANMPGKGRYFRGRVRVKTRSAWKRAVVTLAEGSRVDFYEGR
jgi:large subunit ribosomal protein L23